MAPSIIRSLLLSTGILVSTAAAVRSGGCGKDLPSTQTPGKSHSETITQSNGTPRSYLIHIPSNYDKDTAVPLYFSFHGNGGTAKGQESLSQFSNEDFNPDGIAVYPQGVSVSISLHRPQCLADNQTRIHGRVHHMQNPALTTSVSCKT